MAILRRCLLSLAPCVRLLHPLIHRHWFHLHLKSPSSVTPRCSPYIVCALNPCICSAFCSVWHCATYIHNLLILSRLRLIAVAELLETGLVCLLRFSNVNANLHRKGSRSFVKKHNQTVYNNPWYPLWPEISECPSTDKVKSSIFLGWRSHTWAGKPNLSVYPCTVPQVLITDAQSW